MNSTKKYYEIPQKRIENTEHMCYINGSVLRKGELMLWIIIWKIGLELKQQLVI